MTTLSKRLKKNWLDIIGVEFDQPYMAKLEQFLQSEKDAGHTIYPEDEEIFNALNSTAFDDIKVVIIGQDPYHRRGAGAWSLLLGPQGQKNPPEP